MENHHNSEIVPKIAKGYYGGGDDLLGAYSLPALIALELLREYGENRKFYNSFAKFNFANGQKRKHAHHNKICIGDVPATAKRQIARLRKELGSGEAVFARLGMTITRTNRHSPLEAKWCYEYYKAYGTWDYHPSNTLTDYSVKRRLSVEEARECAKMF